MDCFLWPHRQALKPQPLNGSGLLGHLHVTDTCPPWRKPRLNLGRRWESFFMAPVIFGPIPTACSQWILLQSYATFIYLCSLLVFFCHALAALGFGWSLPFCPKNGRFSSTKARGSLLLYSESFRSSSQKYDNYLGVAQQFCIPTGPSERDGHGASPPSSVSSVMNSWLATLTSRLYYFGFSFAEKLITLIVNARIDWFG
jgi:hypothetical protein